MANEELDFRGCGTTLRALEMSKAQEKMLGAFMSINEESTSIDRDTGHNNNQSRTRTSRAPS